MISKYSKKLCPRYKILWSWNICCEWIYKTHWFLTSKCFQKFHDGSLETSSIFLEAFLLRNLQEGGMIMFRKIVMKIFSLINSNIPHYAFSHTSPEYIQLNKLVLNLSFNMLRSTAVWLRKVWRINISKYLSHTPGHSKYYNRWCGVTITIQIKSWEINDSHLLNDGQPFKVKSNGIE